MKRKQVTAACLMAATMLFSGCTPNISEYAARAQQAGKSFWEGKTTDAMAQDSDAAATAEGETSVAGETQNVSTGTGTAAVTNERQDSDTATDDEIQDSTTATGGEAQHGEPRQQQTARCLRPAKRRPTPLQNLRQQQLLKFRP